MNTAVTVMTISIAGYVIWRRRATFWMMGHDKIMTAGLAFQVAGFALCVPLQSHYLGTILFHLTGTSHIRDYLGHLFFFSGISSITYVTICRLLPDDQVRKWIRRRIEIPGALAAAIMLVALLSSTATKMQDFTDFFTVRCDGWLTVYWIVLGCHCIDLQLTAMRALLILRTDPRSRDVADLFIASLGTGTLTVLCLMFVTLGHQPHASMYVWILLAMSNTLCAVATKESWARRTAHPQDPSSSELKV